jgi:hypothetical protein
MSATYQNSVQVNGRCGASLSTVNSSFKTRLRTGISLYTTLITYFFGVHNKMIQYIFLNLE